MQKYKLDRDDSSHWYLIPIEKHNEFKIMMRDLEENDYPSELLKEFEEKFEKHMISNPYDLIISIHN